MAKGIVVSMEVRVILPEDIAVGLVSRAIAYI